MRNDVHLAALRAAARVAFSVASVAALSGCSSVDETDGEASGSSDSALASTGGEASEPCPDTKPSKPSCEAVLASAFPVPGDYQWEPVPQPADVVACCHEELATHGAASIYRWDCCVAYDPATVPPGERPPFGGEHGMACTPWGPPVPPHAQRLGRRRARFVRKVSGLSLRASRRAPAASRAMEGVA